MEKAIYFDMDGTIADLYNVIYWLEGLREYKVYPYLEARPMWDMLELNHLLGQLKAQGYRIGVITWLSKESTIQYDREVRWAKKLWLETYGMLNVLDEIQMVKYGTPKHEVADLRHGILIDDNAAVRADWENDGGITIDPTTENILDILARLIEG